MKFAIPFVALSLVANWSVAETPKIFAGLLEENTPVKGNIGVVVPPSEIDKYVAKVETAARKDPKWFREFTSTAKQAGTPLPYDEKLGLTKQEYEEYLALWAKRDFKPLEEVVLMLRQSAGNTWTISATGPAASFTTLRYSPKDDVFRSPNGDLKRMDDIKADKDSILGEWSGMEWRFEEETVLGKTRENIALGKFAEKKFGLIVYRAQELSSEGTKLLDKSIVVRFPIAGGAAVKEVKPAPAPVKPAPAPVKPAPKPVKPTPKAPAKR